MTAHHFKLNIFMFFLLLATTTSAAPLNWSTQLPNGMKIIIIEDHSNPLAASIINIRAGSHTETIQNNGISHLLEHLLFDGTASRTASELKNSVESQGGYFNAFTRKDYVSFEIVMPSETFSLGLSLQADQLLNSTIPETELSRERSVVCEEIATDDGSSSSAADAILWQELFGTQGYGLPVIGNYQTVTDVPRDDIVNFYRSRYVPNRMTAVIVGDVDPHTVLTELRRLYGPVPSGLENPGPGSMPDFPVGGSRTIVAKPVKESMITMVYPGPDPAELEYTQLEFAVKLWADSLSGSLQNALSPFGSRISAYLSPHRGFSLLNISLIPNDVESPDLVLENINLAIQKSIIEFLEAPHQETELKALIQSRRVDQEFAREKFHHLARDIGGHAALGTLDRYWNFHDELSQVSMKSVLNEFETWLKNILPVCVMIVPEDIPEEEKMSPLIPQIRTLSSGLTVIAQFDPYADISAVHLLTPNIATETAGISRMVAELLNSGTETMSAEQLEKALAERGIRTKLADWTWLPFDDYYDSIEYNYLRMECLAGDLDYALKQLNSMAFESILPESACVKLSSQMSMLSRRNSSSSSDLSKKALKQILFTDDFYQQMRLPSSNDLEQITPEHLRDYYKKCYRPESCVLSVVGNVLPDSVFASAEKWFGGKTVESKKQVQSPVTGSPVRVFTPVDAEMGYIRGALPVELSAEDLAAWSVTVNVLSELLQDEIRAKRGKSYRLGAWITELKGITVIELGVGTRMENISEIEQVTREIVSNLDKYSISQVTVDGVKQSLKGHEQRYRQRRINRAYYLGWRHWQGYGIGFETDYLDLIEAVTIDDVKRILRKLPSGDQWFWSIAGAKEARDE